MGLQILAANSKVTCKVTYVLDRYRLTGALASVICSIAAAFSFLSNTPR